MKKKTGILTFHRAVNYGAVLQVYALQTKVKELGAECEIIDYRNERLEHRHRKISLFENLSPKGILKYFLLYRNANKKYEKFTDFRNTYLNVSEVYSTNDELKKKNSQYDLYLVGSDQVWNHSIHDFDHTYFLDFVDDNKKRNSYAGSFGISKIPTELQAQYSNLLSKFNQIAVREKQGADLVEDLIGEMPEVVMDPTLLMSKEEWNILVSQERYIGEKYILLYGFSGSKHLINLAESIAKKTGYKIVFIQNTHKMQSGINYIKDIGPLEWLNLFKHAEVILTNSFHGTAFSINFNKQFYTEFLPEKYGVNSRLEDILNLFDLSDRRINSNDDSIINNQIDYDKVNVKLDEERSKSLNILSNILTQ